MSKNVRRRGRRRACASKGNWFTRMKMWQRVSLCAAAVLICLVFAGAAYVYAKWNKIDTQEIKADDLIINEEVKANQELDLGDGYTRKLRRIRSWILVMDIQTSRCLALIPVMVISGRETVQIVLLLPV